ncbi:c-type cytochrome [Janthinobacterium fluminis]|uniref:C-type cytochrome n=1 Tax=Janthinobacterium fluminis TaxID=2987524 RepID=A0ABT5K9Q5_9BURK|nr:c-type cytochrome [Janthinobacterium fluminis]MDC8760796.1 c-type cytochrome [Janthinobacterium fluminis]
MKRLSYAGPPALAALACAALLGGCQRGEPAAGAADIQLAETLLPAEPALARQYERSCRLCHASAASKAPLTGFAAAWEARLRQGMPALLEHVRQGYRTMPAKGYCNDCADADFEKLIQFMARDGKRGAA